MTQNKLKGEKSIENKYETQCGMLVTNRWTHFAKLEDNPDDAEFVSDAETNEGR